MLNSTQDSSPLSSSLSPPGVGCGATAESSTSNSGRSQYADPARIAQPSRATQNGHARHNHLGRSQYPAPAKHYTHSITRSPRSSARCSARLDSFDTSTFSRSRVEQQRDYRDNPPETLTLASYPRSPQPTNASSFSELATTHTPPLDTEIDGSTTQEQPLSLPSSYMEPPPRRRGQTDRSTHRSKPASTRATTPETPAAMLGIQRPLGVEHQFSSYSPHYAGSKRTYSGDFISNRRGNQFELSDNGYASGLVDVGGFVGQGSHEDARSPGLGQEDLEGTLEVDDTTAFEYEPHGPKRARTAEGSEQESGWNELKTKAGKERKRLPLACIMCRRKKIRCSGEKPGCKHCLRSRIPCVYKQTARKTAPRTDYMAMLDRRLKRMEERLLKHVPKEEVSGVLATTGRSVVKPTTSAASGKKRSSSIAFEDDSDFWGPGSRASKQILHDGLSNPALPAKPLEADTDGGSSMLPRKDVQEHLVEVYFDCIYGQPYLLLHKPSFMRQLRNGKAPPILVLAVCAVSARFSKHPGVRHDPSFLAGEQFAIEARRLILKHFDTPDITNMTACMLLALHEFGTCHGGREWSFSGMAMRMAQALKLHKEVDSNDLATAITRMDASSNEYAEENVESMSLIDQELRRRCMWACFLQDRFHTAGTDRPWVFQESDMAIQLPHHDRALQISAPAITEQLDGSIRGTSDATDEEKSRAAANMGLGAYIVRIVALYSRVTKYLQQGGKDKETEDLWDSRSHHSELKSELQLFFTNLPAKFRYSDENFTMQKAEKSAGSFVFLHVVYHTVRLYLQLPILMVPSDKVPDHVESQASEISLDSAAKIAEIIQDAYDRGTMITAPFLGFCVFSVSLVHLVRMFDSSGSTQQEAQRYLKSCLRFILHIKQHWGLFQSVTDKIKALYHKFSEAAKTSGIQPEHHDIAWGQMLSYGDWFMKYPHGLLGEEHEIQTKPHIPDTIRSPDSRDDGPSSYPGIQTADEFFAPLNPRDADAQKGISTRASSDRIAQKSRRASGQQSRGFVQEAVADMASPLSLPPRSSASNSRTPVSTHSHPNPSPAVHASPMQGSTPKLMQPAGESALADALGNLGGDISLSGTPSNTRHRGSTGSTTVEHQTGSSYSPFSREEQTAQMMDPRVHMHQHEQQAQFSAYSPVSQSLTPGPPQVSQLTGSHSPFSRSAQPPQDAAAFLFEPYPGGSDSSSLMAALSTGLWQGFEDSGVGSQAPFGALPRSIQGQIEGSGGIPTSRASTAAGAAAASHTDPQQSSGAWFMGFAPAPDYGSVDGLAETMEPSNRPQTTSTTGSSGPRRKFSSSTEYQQQR